MGSLLAGLRERIFSPETAQARLKSQERTHIDKAGLAVIVFKGWKNFAPTVLMKQLKAHGCFMAMGDKRPVVIDQTGNVHALNRLVNMASKAEGKPLKITAKQTVNYVRRHDLPFYADIQKKGKINDRTIPELGAGQEGYFIPEDLSGSLWSKKDILDLMGNQTGDKPSPIDQIQQLLETIAQQQVQILSSQGKILQRPSALES
ncbi:hypothetical protein [Acetobacter fabarum]|uniref:hypothetical protein n=1 Tax=Acetobacter fabarum TaxID=483199 RepID=UPI0039EAD969